MHRLVPLLLILVVLPARSEPDPRLRDYFAAEVEPSGLWRQDNADFDGQPGSARYWLSRNSWGPGDHSMIANVEAVLGDGRCEAVAQLVQFVDHADGEVHSMSLTSAGIVFSAIVERGDGGELIRLARGTAPNGTEIVFRDRSGFEDADTRWSQGESPDGDGWKPRDRVTWHRVDTAPDCGRHGPKSGAPAE